VKAWFRRGETTEPKVTGSSPVGCTDLRRLEGGTCPRACTRRVEIDESLAKLLAAWPKLGEGIRKAILAIAEASVIT
jgi:hypothetical protein